MNKAVQINKKVPYLYVQNVQQILAQLTTDEPVVEEEKVEDPKDKKAQQQNKQLAQIQQLQEQMKQFKMDNEFQAPLLLFFKYFNSIQMLLQNYINQRQELLKLFISTYAPQLNAVVICSSKNKDAIPQKLAKQLEAQLPTFEKDNFV